MSKLTYQGRPCKYGHSGIRYLKSRACVDCRHEKAKKEVRTPEQLEKMKAHSRSWYLRNKDRRAKEQKKKRQADPATYKHEQRTSYQKNRQKRLAKCREYYAANKEKSFQKVHKRRALRTSAGGTFTTQDIKTIFARQKGKCASCRCKLVTFHRDHILPLALGGDSNPNNIQLLCPPCNLRKHAKHPVEFMQEMGYLL